MRPWRGHICLTRVCDNSRLQNLSHQWSLVTRAIISIAEHSQMVRRLIPSCVVCLLVSGLGCKKAANDQPTALKPPEVSVSPVIDRSVTDYEAFTGRVEAAESVDIRARVSGYLNEIDFKDGDEVKQGQMLFQIDPRQFEAELKNAEGSKAQWLAKRDRAKADVSRYESLVPTGAASAQDLDKARADLGEAVAAIQSSEAAIDRAKLDLEFSRITAPIDGQISRSKLTKGNLVRPDQEVLTSIVSLNPIYIYFNVSERSLLKFRDRARVVAKESAMPDVRELKVPVYVGLDNEEGYPHEGVINFADNKVDAATGTIKVRGTFDNSRHVFKPGFFARVRVPVSDPYKGILVTDRAIGTDQSQKFVYVVDDKDIAQYRAVKLGPLEDDGLRVITAGLQPGDMVIVNGMQRARPGKPVTPLRVEMPRAGNPGASSPPTSAPAQPADSAKSGQH